MLIGVVRDEMTHLPHFLAHHRALGVSRFAFVDNRSVDGTRDFLLAQPDCDVYAHDGGWLDAACGAVWRNLLIVRYAAAPWHLGIDADELTVYDGWPGRGIDEAVAALRAAGRRCGTGLMLDMYGAGPILTTRVAPGQGLLDACPWFDGDGYTFDMPPDGHTGPPMLNIRGGPEMRAVRQRSDFGWLAKNALIIEPGILFRNPHALEPEALNFTHPQLALLHVRWFDHFAGKLERLRGWRQHTAGSIDAYESVGARLLAEPSFSFYYPGSVQLESGRQLVELGLISPL